MTNAAPGWYDDGSREQRWWDGERWTEHVVTQLQPRTPPAGWYDDGSGRQRWWDGQTWGHFAVENVAPASGVGVEMQISLVSWPLWFLLLSDERHPSHVSVRVFPGFDPQTPPTFDTPGQIADADVDEWEGAPLNIAVHSSQRELIASLGDDVVQILSSVSNDVQAAIGEAGRDGAAR